MLPNHPCQCCLAHFGVLRSLAGHATHSSVNHYHIRWGNSKIDWEAFQSEEEAKASAEQLKGPGETYTVDQCDSTCQMCTKAARKTPPGV